MGRISKPSETKGKNKAAKSPVKVRLKPLADGRRSVYLDIYVGGKRSYEFLELYLLPETDEKAAKKNEATLRKAERVAKSRAEEIRRQIKLVETASASQTEQTLPRQMLLTEWMDVFYELQKNNGVRDIQHIIYAKGFMERYNPGLRLCDIDVNVCAGFVNFLKTQKKKNGEPYSSKTLFSIVGELKTALNTAVRAGYIGENPLLKLSPHEKIKPKEHKRDFLTINEIKRFAATPCDCEIVKRAYLFSCSCGLRLGDIRNLKWGDIYKAEGKTFMITRMAKIGRTITLPLGKQAVRWLPVRNQDSHEDDRVFPDLNGNLLAKHLTEWAKTAGIKKNVTFHTARYSFATSLLTVGVDIYTVSKLLGHTSIRHTQRYAQIVNKIKEDAVNRIDGIYDNSSGAQINHQTSNNPDNGTNKEE